MVARSRSSSQTVHPSLDRLPRQLLAGITLIAAAWPVAWFGPVSLAEYSFFPLWLGYILAVDGIVERRSSTSLLKRSTRRFLALFLVSIPFWWLYEALNARLGNWEYLYPRQIGFVERHLHASVAFSTVVPALFETAEFYSTTRLPARLGRWRRIAPSRQGLVGFSCFGLVMIALVLAFPRQAYPLVWLGLFLALDPIVNLGGGRSISDQVARGRWQTVAILFGAGITCGFFWEMWNYWSMPKWIYHVPYVGHPKLFEMPLLGYGGYLPFALEVYAAVQAANLIVRFLPAGYLRFDEAAAIESRAADRRVRES
jgi:hypothetical protein